MASRRSEAEWQQLIKQQQNSNVSQKAFCQQMNLSVATFGYWKRKLKKETDLPAIVDDAALTAEPWLELPTPTIRGNSVAGSAWQIELDLGNGVCLRLRQAG